MITVRCTSCIWKHAYYYRSQCDLIFRIGRRNKTTDVRGPRYPPRNAYILSVPSFLRRLSSACVWHTRIYVYGNDIFNDEKFDHVWCYEGLHCVSVNIILYALLLFHIIICLPWDKTCRSKPIETHQNFPHDPHLYYTVLQSSPKPAKYKKYRKLMWTLWRRRTSRCYILSEYNDQ